ncbi:MULTISPECIES: hypothetical protein [Streptomyces]|uniref:Uncharacterized protein n=1 Tax=Streptomyces luteosporeus TaxID=173856 RepID=A0ABN3TPV2_9ACTN
MPFTISQGKGTPESLRPGTVGSLVVDVGLTPDTQEPVRKGEWVQITFPRGVSFPQEGGGRVGYVCGSRRPEPQPTHVWDPKARTLRFRTVADLVPGPPSGCFYAVDVRADDEAQQGTVHGRMEIGGVQNDVVIDIVGGRSAGVPAFRTYTLPIQSTHVASVATATRAVEFPGRIRKDEDDNKIIDVLLKGFEFEVRRDGRPEDFEIGAQRVSVSWRNSGHRSGEVVVEAQLTPRPDEARNQGWTFQGSVEVLVIAELEP